jgi:hypothetical protein
MPRMSKKFNKLAFDILGVPANIASKKTKREREIDRRLRSEDQRIQR